MRAHRRGALWAFKDIMETSKEGVTVGKLEVIARILEDKNEYGDESSNKVTEDIIKNLTKNTIESKNQTKEH